MPLQRAICGAANAILAVKYVTNPITTEIGITRRPYWRMELEVAIGNEVSDAVSDRRTRVSCTVYLDLIPVRTSAARGFLAILCKAKRVQGRELGVRISVQKVDVPTNWH
jgi:hypothetical protein